MSTQLTAEDARQSLATHAAAKGREVLNKYGPRLGWSELLSLLRDRTCVRYPCEVVFDAAPLQKGEFAFPLPQGDRPEDGYKLCVHPAFQSQPNLVPYLVLYQLVVVNYGPFASPEDAEAFGAAALGLDREEYYNTLCRLADSLDCAG